MDWGRQRFVLGGIMSRVCEVQLKRSSGRRMKRHPALVPLSREHHTGLVMAQRLILGRSTNPRSPWPSEVHGQADRLLLFFQEELQPHFDFEETELFARLLEWPTEDALPWQPLLQDLVRDHVVMRALINELSIGRDVGLSDRLRAFGEQLRAHIHSEERELFQRIQTECSIEQLTELTQIVAAYAETPGPSCEF